MRTGLSKSALRLFLLSILIATALSADSTGQSYRLSTLDHRLAALEVQEICERVSSSRRCSVQTSTPGEIVVFGPEKAHAAIREMLAVEDLALPITFGFRVALLQEGSPGADSPEPPDIARAIEGVEEMLGLTDLTIGDVGVIQMADRGSLRLIDENDRLYDVEMLVSSVTTRHRVPEITLELAVRVLPDTGDDAGELVLSSVVTIKAGETIVAGSSRSKPHKEILVVLLTANPLTLDG